MRGVHTYKLFQYKQAQGSSPHARGPLAQSLCQLVQSGIIPACAGSTIALMVKSAENWDHPRMRGVHGMQRA